MGFASCYVFSFSLTTSVGFHVDVRLIVIAVHWRDVTHGRIGGGGADAALVLHTSEHRLAVGLAQHRVTIRARFVRSLRLQRLVRVVGLNGVEAQL